MTGAAAAASIAGVVLAAGASTRLGQPKQLLPFRGRPLVRLAAEEALAVCGRVAVVVGASRDAVVKALAGAPVTVVDNPDWAEGMASSIVAGVAWASHAACAAVLLLACDQPHVHASHLAGLVSAWRRTGRPAASSYDGTLGVPAVFPAACFTRLLALRGAAGARRILVEADAQPVAWPEGAFDIDTPEDALRLHHLARDAG